MSHNNSEFEQKIDLVLKDAPENRHSYFQLKHFILGKQPTTQSQMWQCLRELQSKKETLDKLHLEIEETQDLLQLLDLGRRKKQIQSEKNKPNTALGAIREEEGQIRLRRYERQKITLTQTLVKLKKDQDFITQEARFFLQAYEALSARTPLKDYDDLEAQKEYWNEKITQAINLKMILGQPLDMELVQTALALHEDAPIKLSVLHYIEGLTKRLNGPGTTMKITSDGEN